MAAARVRRAAGGVAGGLVVLGLLAGCAGAPQSSRLAAHPGAFAEPVELREVPFFPQEAYQCGPAALATVFTWAGAPATPEVLRPQVYVPERRGSLQPEMVAAARRRRLVPYVLEPALEDLLAEVRAGHPVIVLQNLSLACCPVWHYAVAVGYDLSAPELVLRSGTTRRRVTALDAFERTWARGGRWALVVLPPGELPATAAEARYLRAVAELERLGHLGAAEAAYSATAERWRRSLGAYVGLGNVRYAGGDLAGAAAALRQGLERHGGAAVLHNNLAHVLMEQGRLEQALEHARRAVAAGGPHGAAFRQTLETIRGRLEASERPNGR